jgi:hypothetical protein
VPHICPVLADVGFHGYPRVTLYRQRVFMSMVIYTLYTQGPKFVESHICQNRADTAFIKESRMEFPEANRLHRKYGLWGNRHSLRTKP